MIIYGLTGGIGSGKSTVAELFRDHGVVVFDADQIGREILSEGSETTRKVIERFPGCSPDASRIDRSELARIVFADGQARKWLENLLHPVIWEEFLSRAGKACAPGKTRHPFCLLEGAVFLESDVHYPLAGLIVVSAPEETRRLRVLRRGDLDAGQIEARLRTQLPEEEKLAKASHVIDNSQDLEKTRRQVDSVLAALDLEHGGPA